MNEEENVITQIESEIKKLRLLVSEKEKQKNRSLMSQMGRLIKVLTRIRQAMALKELEAQGVV